jgi:hypothetical protein
MRRTVFVLGAGASNVFGLPLGGQLCKMAYNQLTPETDYGADLRQYAGFRDNEINEFCRQLEKSAQPSVDAFLEYRREFMRLGKPQ